MWTEASLVAGAPLCHALRPTSPTRGPPTDSWPNPRPAAETRDTTSQLASATTPGRVPRAGHPCLPHLACQPDKVTSSHLVSTSWLVLARLVALPGASRLAGPCADCHR